MKIQLPLTKRLCVYWIAAIETAKLAIVTARTVRDMEAYTRKQILPENIKQLIPAVLVDLIAGCRIDIG